MKVLYNNLIASINSNGEKLKTIPLKSRIRQGCLFASYIFNITVEVLDGAIRHEGDQGVTNWKGRS